MWNNLEISTKRLGLQEFKDKLKEKLKPIRVKHHSYGSKIGNTFLTRIRLDRSDLNLHKFIIGQVEYYIPNFQTFNKTRKYEILVFGLHPENNEYNYTNMKISFAVQN